MLNAKSLGKAQAFGGLYKQALLEACFYCSVYGCLVGSTITHRFENSFFRQFQSRETSQLVFLFGFLKHSRCVLFHLLFDFCERS